jgi:hypothetical protein
MRLLHAPLLSLLAVTGCGGGGRDDPPDGAPGAADASPGADAGGPDAGTCDKPVIFVNTLGAGAETYTEGPDASSANRSALIEGEATFGPMDTDLDATVTAARDLLGPLGVTVTDVDPGDAAHLEVVIVGTGWQLDAGYAAVALGYCSLRSNGVALVNAFPGRMPGDLAVSIAYTVGLMDGLELSVDLGNCMQQGANIACSFSATAEVIQPPRCPGVGETQDQLAILADNLACD